MSERGTIVVEGFSVQTERESTCFGGSGYVGFTAPRFHRARLDLVLDDAGLDRFLDVMEQICPGFSRGRPRRVPEAPALPETTRALPAGPIAAEFVDG